MKFKKAVAYIASYTKGNRKSLVMPLSNAWAQLTSYHHT